MDHPGRADASSPDSWEPDAEAVARVKAEAAWQCAELVREPRCSLAAAIFAALADSHDLATIVARGGDYFFNTWSLFAAVQLLVDREKPAGFARYFQEGHEGTALADTRFSERLGHFCLEHAHEITGLVASRTCQMNEVDRCGAALLPGLAHIRSRVCAAPIELIDVGCSAGLQLLFDLYAYDFGAGQTWSDPNAVTAVNCRLAGGTLPDLEAARGAVVGRVGIDRKPPRLDDPDTRDWIIASSGHSRTRTAALLRIALRERVPILTGDAVELVPKVIAEVPTDRLPLVYDSASLVYFPADRREAFVSQLHEIGARRDLVWLSYESFMPQSDGSVTTVQGSALPPDVAKDVAGGAFWVCVEMTAWIDGTAETRTLAVAHPWGLWVRWLGEDQIDDHAT